MVLVDTSLWTHALRRHGDPDLRAKVESLLKANEAAWCDMVRLELWNGVGSDSDRQALTKLEATLPILPIGPEVWQAAARLADRARDAGITCPATDLLIFCCAKVHGVRLEHRDRHYELLHGL